MRLRWLFAALLLCAALLGYFARQHLAESRRASAQLAAWQQEEQLEAALDKSVEIRLGKRVSLQTWLNEFTKQTDVQVVLNDPDQQLPADFQVHLDLTPQPASSALDALARETNLNWSSERNGVVGLYAYPHFPKPYLRTYALRPTFSSQLQKQIAEAAQSTIESDSWERVGGQGALIEAPNQLIVSQHSYVHRRLRPFLESLQAQLVQTAAIDPAGLSPDDPRLKPAILGAQSSTHAELDAALDKRISLDVVERPLKDVIAEIADKLNLTIVMSMQLEADGIRGDEPVTLAANNLRASTILKLILGQFGARVIPGSGGNVLRVVTYDQAHSPDNQVTRAYPIPDFSLADDQTHRLVGTLTWVIEADSWDDVGGPGSCRVLGNLLLVTQAEHNLPRIEAFLTALRTARSGRQRWASAVPASLDRDRTLRILDQPLALQYDKRPLQEVMSDIAKRTGLFIQLTKKIEDAGATSASPVTCNLPSLPLRQNLRSLLGPLYLTYLVRDETVAITTIEDAQSPDHMEVEVFDARPLLANRQFTPGELTALVYAAVEPDSWVDVGGPGSIYELQGLLVVCQRAEMLDQSRHALEAIEEQCFAKSLANKHANLINRTPVDQHPNSPPIHLYAVDDLLAPQGPYSQLQLKQNIRDVTVSDGAQESYLLEMQIHCNRFVVVYLRPSQVAPFEENLRKLRNLQH